MNFVTWSVRLVDKINESVGKMLQYGVLVMFVLVLIEVVRRYLFNSPTVWGNESTQLVFGVYAVLCGGYVLKQGVHASSDIFYSRWSNRGKALADIITFPLFFVFVLVILLSGGSLAGRSLATLEHSYSAWNPPIYPFKLLIPIGALLLLIQGLAKLVRDFLVIYGTQQPIRETDEEED